MKKEPLVRARQFLVFYVLTLLPVLVICHETCHYERPGILLPLFFAEWTLLVVVLYFLCSWLGGKGVLIAAVLFLLFFCVFAVVVRDSVATYGTIWNGSDDVQYLNQAATVADSLRRPGWNLHEAWSEFLSVEKVDWTLAGWPFLLGFVSSLVSTAASVELIHAVALSLNATFLVLVLALVYFILRQPARRHPAILLICFILMLGNPVVYAGMSLKESFLQFLLMLASALCLNLPRRRWWLWAIAFGFSVFGIATTRVAYIPLILAVLYWQVMGRIGVRPFLRMVLGAIIIAFSLGFILNYPIRNVEVAKMMQGSLEAEPGFALSVYHIPVIGPVLYYAISPTPPLPWRWFTADMSFTKLIQYMGSIAWFVAACYVLIGAVSNHRLWRNGHYLFAAFMFVGIFAAAVLFANDPRYKQPTNFYLSILLFFTWLSGRKDPAPTDVAGVSHGQ